MEKIIFFYSDKIFGKNGGSLSSRRFYELLNNLKSKQKIDDLLIVSLDNLPNPYGIRIKKNKLLDVASRVLLKSNYLYFPLRHYRKVFRDYKPSKIFINSRMDFIARFFKKTNPHCEIFVYFDNIEFDYCRNAVPKWAVCIEKQIVFRAEKNSVSTADGLFFLTRRDRDRCVALYGGTTKKDVSNMIFPITITPSDSLTIAPSKPTLLLLGSLSYKPNSDSIIWFFDNIFPFLQKDVFDVIVAGNNPPEKIESLCRRNRVCLKSNFGKLSDFVPQKTCLLAPLFSGAGMKTKVAESLSYGMFVIGTFEAFVGYEDVFDNNPSFVRHANTSNEFLEAIKDYSFAFSNNATFNQNHVFFERFYLTSSYEEQFYNFVFKNVSTIDLTKSDTSFLS